MSDYDFIRDVTPSKTTTYHMVQKADYDRVKAERDAALADADLGWSYARHLLGCPARAALVATCECGYREASIAHDAAVAQREGGGDAPR